MNEKTLSSKILSITLFIGGIFPFISGLFAMFGTDFYVRFLSNGIPNIFNKESYSLFLIVWGLQGGDAFVAGISRIFVSFSKSINLKLLFSFIGIFHSIYELILLNSKLLEWMNKINQINISNIFYIEVWMFIVLHIILIIGFTMGILFYFKERKKVKSI